MANTTAPATVTSFSNTPQAADDLLLAAQSGLTEDSTNIVFFEVMANDLGGNAKSLWSIDDGFSAPTATKILSPADLLTQDVARTESTNGDRSANGANIWITADGKVGYDANSLNATFRSQLQHLSVGESLTDSFTYAIRLGNGTLSWATATIQINGTNDAPIITNATTALAGAVTEDTTLSATGQLSASDVDNGATQTWSVQGNAAGTYGAIVVDPASGQWTFSLNNAAANVQALAAGEAHTEAFTVRVTDDKDAVVDQLVSITINGTNDAASISGSSTGAVTEDRTLTTRGTLAVADVDNGEAVFQAQTNVIGSFGSFNIGTDGNWAYALNNGAANVQALAEGQQTHDSFTVLSKDGTASQLVTVAITGSNDTPLVATADVTGAVTEQGIPSGNLTDRGTIGFTDVDLTDVHSISAVTRSAGALGTLTASVSTDTTGSGAGGVVTWNYSVADSAVEYLAAGQTKVETFSFNVLDGHGASVARTVSVTVTGTNDAPVLQGTQTDQLYISSLSVWTPFLVNNGVWVTPGGASSGDMEPHTFVRQFTAAQDGNYVFQFAVDNEGSVLVDGVAIPGLYNNDWSHSTVQTVVLTAGIHTVTMNALNWGGPAAFAMNITDPNNHEIWNTRTHLDPEPLILSYTENQAAMVVSAGLTLTDIDSSTMTHATVAVGTGFAADQDILGFANQNGITGAYDASTGVLSLSGSATQVQYQAALRSVTYSNSSDSPSMADRTINFTVDDGSGQFNLSNTVQSKITILAVNDAPTGVATAVLAAGTEDTAYTVSGSSLLAGFSDVDAGDTLSVSGLTASNGAVVTNANGTFTISPTDNFNGAVALNYNVLDGHGGSVAATQSYTLTAVNDDATISDDASSNQDKSVIEAGTGVEGDPFASGKLLISDVDAGEAKFQAPNTVIGTYGNFTFNANTGAWTYQLRDADANVQALTTGQTVTDTLHVLSFDGTAAKDVIVGIAGSNDSVDVIGTQTLTFTNVSGAIGIYNGFNFTALDSLYYSSPDWYGTGSQTYNGYAGRISDMVAANGADFSVDKLDISEYSGAKEVDIKGFTNGAQTYNKHIVLTPAMQTVALDYANIDDLQIVVTVGTASPGQYGWWLIDNIMVA